MMETEIEKLKALLAEVRRVFIAVDGWEDLLDAEQNDLLERIDAALSSHKGKS